MALEAAPGSPGDTTPEARGISPVVLAEPVRSASAVVELEASGVRLRVEAGTDVRYVADLVAAIRARC